MIHLEICVETTLLPFAVIWLWFRGLSYDAIICFLSLLGCCHLWSAKKRKFFVLNLEVQSIFLCSKWRFDFSFECQRSPIWSRATSQYRKVVVTMKESVIFLDLSEYHTRCVQTSFHCFNFTSMNVELLQRLWRGSFIKVCTSRQLYFKNCNFE